VKFLSILSFVCSICLYCLCTPLFAQLGDVQNTFTQLADHIYRATIDYQQRPNIGVSFGQEGLFLADKGHAEGNNNPDTYIELIFARFEKDEIEAQANGEASATEVVRREIRSSGQSDDLKPQFATYEDMRKHLGELFQQKKYREAADLLEWALDRFPDHLLANTYNLALMRMYLEEFEKSAQALHYGLDHDIFYSRFAFGGDVWAPLRETEGFRKFEARNEAKIKEAQKKARAEILVVEPEEFSELKRYPLFIALHGGGENISAFKPNWTSPKLKKEFIVAYLQSSQVVAMDGFNWTEDIELTKTEIKNAYLSILEDYPIDVKNVFVGGFSSGGVAALEVILSNIFPVAGFISLCPAKPDNFSAEQVREAKERGVLGTLLTTEMDPRLPDQKEMARIFETENFPLEFIVTPNIGHWYPEDMEAKIDQAIDFIRRGRNREID
jgi:predicted esterase